MANDLHPKIYQPPAKNDFAGQEAAVVKKLGTPNIKRIYKKKITKGEESLSRAEKKVWIEWQGRGNVAKAFAEAAQPPVTREQQALGVSGTRVYDVKTGKFLGYTSDTQFQQFLPKKGSLEEQQLNAVSPYLNAKNMPKTAPRYYSGDEIKPAAEGTPQTRADLQAKLAAAHMYGGAGYTKGVWNDVDIQAYGSALSAANQAGMDVNEWLDQAAAAPEIKDSDSNPISLTLTNPEDIKKTAEETARTIYGGLLPKDVIDRMVEAFHEKEIQNQTAAQVNNQVGGISTDTESLDTFIESEIKKRYPNEVGATAFGNAMDKIVSTFTTPVA